MATTDQTPRGRGYDSALLYFYHENDFVRMLLACNSYAV